MGGKSGDIKSFGKLYRDGDKLRIHLGMSDESFVQDHVFDLAQGGLPVSFTSTESKLKATAKHTYEKIGDSFVPKEITYFETDPKTGKTRFDLDFQFRGQKVNGPIPGEAFDPKLNLMMNGVTRIQSFRSNRIEPAPR